MNGILVVDKPRGLTSHDIVLLIRRRFKLKKVGHAGTLDPMATGVLVILIGKATKLSGSLSLDDKEYEGIVSLGAETDTGDSEGSVVSRGDLCRFIQYADISQTKGQTKRRLARFSTAIKHPFKGIDIMHHFTVQ